MSTTPVPPTPARNRVGLTRNDYEGAKTTLCPGCGHNAITSGIIQAAYESALEPHRIAKLSGIGCSSKTPTYFLGDTIARVRMRCEPNQSSSCPLSSRICSAPTPSASKAIPM